MQQSENELLTRIGPGTKMGELLRRYWWPVGFTEQVTNKPVPVRILGEDLVMFRDGSGKVGLLERACPHRRTSLENGRVEQNGIRCCYHGWLFAANGQCLEMPAEPANSPLVGEMKTRAYKTQEAAGLVFAYMGPDPVPLLPGYDLLVRDDLDRTVRAGLDRCNWLQRAENGADPCHSMALHASVYPSIALKRPEAVYEKTWYGMRFAVQYENKNKNVYHHIVPSHTRRLGARAGYSHPAQFLHLRVPVDDEQTLTYIIEAVPTEDGRPGAITTKGLRIGSGKHERVEDGWWGIASRDQDRVAQESQGVIVDRTKEWLASSDLGIVMLRRMLLDGIDAIDKGTDPMGVIRKADQNGLIEFDAQKNFTDIEADKAEMQVG